MLDDRGNLCGDAGTIAAGSGPQPTRSVQASIAMRRLRWWLMHGKGRAPDVPPGRVLAPGGLAAGATKPRRIASPPLLLYGMECFVFGMSLYLLGVALVLPRYLLDLNQVLTPISAWLVWYSGVPIVVGIVLAATDTLLLHDRKRRSGPIRLDPVRDQRVTVALTAYNDEASIGAAVRDFIMHPAVRRVIVVSNNSTDTTLERARFAGAVTINEARQGYGHCVHRCLAEAVRYEDAELVVLCEGDCTFRAYDIEKLLAYIPHADIVNGTRTVDLLRGRRTQLSSMMYYGNLFVGKLLEAKHLGRSTLTDAGTTYKLCRRSAIEQMIPDLNPSVNLEFNPHFLDIAMKDGLLVLECPITFHPRVGISKGGNTNNWRALNVGLRMICGITLGWKFIAE